MGGGGGWEAVYSSTKKKTCPLKITCQKDANHKNRPCNHPSPLQQEVQGEKEKKNACVRYDRKHDINPVEGYMVDNATQELELGSRFMQFHMHGQ